MIGSIITRVLVMIFGYAYPAYECYKTVEMNKPSIEQLRFWCQYWILVAVLTVSERIGDTFISWVPMYSEAKLAFYIYLWYPKTMGTKYVYDSFFRPYLSKHESDIDRNLFELKTRAGDIAVLYCQKAASYGQTRIYDVLQYVAAQSTSKPRPAQNQQAAVTRASSATNRTPPPVSEEPLSPASPASPAEEEEAHEMSTTSQPSPAAVLNAHKSVPAQSHVETSSSPSSSGAETKQIKTISSPASDNPPVRETAMEEAVRITRGRLRKTRSAFNSV